MADTVVTLGDAVLTKRLIDRSITEYVDSTVTTVGAHAFQSCVNLESVILENAITINKDAFDYCSKLKKIVLPRVESLDGDGFGSECKLLSTVDFGALKRISGIHIYLFSWTSQEVALIIRTNSVCVVESQTFKIENKNCYIYVPSVLVDSYKTASKWSAYADRIRAIEDYPEVCDPYSWEVVFKTIEAGTYKDIYKIGDCIPLDLGSKGVINMQIAAFDADDLADGSGKAPITWIAKEAIPFSVASFGNPAWSTSLCRTYCNETIKGIIPKVVSDKIRTVVKFQLEYDGAGCCSSLRGREVSINDDVWIPSAKEVGGDTFVQHYNSCSDGYGNRDSEPNGHFYTDFFTSDANRIKTNVGGNAVQWLLRSENDNPSQYWRVVTSSGVVGYQSSGNCVICFCT